MNQSSNHLVFSTRPNAFIAQPPPTHCNPRSRHPIMASSLMLATTVARLPSSPLEVRPTPRRRFAAVFTVRAEGGINPDVRKNEDKVVDSVVVSELAKPLTAYCRCWRSGTFPLCDGSHVKHNKATGDNVGPLLVKK